MDDSLIRMISCAETAANLSASRRKRVSLVIEPEGVRVKGEYFNTALQLAAEHSLIVGWPSILDSETALPAAIELIDDRLTERWRKDGE